MVPATKISIYIDDEIIEAVWKDHQLAALEIKDPMERARHNIQYKEDVIGAHLQVIACWVHAGKLVFPNGERLILRGQSS